MESNISAYESQYGYTKALLKALGFSDSITRLHSARVFGLSEAIGIHYGLNEQELKSLRMSSCFHDIGKIGIPEKILLKPARLDAREWDVMKLHSEMGEKLMLSTDWDGSRSAAEAIRHHHEHYDGLGYPDRISGKRIPVCSRIISIADSYDAMAVTRPHHRARTHEEIIQILQDETGEKHDPELMPIFFEIVESSPFKYLGN